MSKLKPMKSVTSFLLLGKNFSEPLFLFHLKKSHVIKNVVRLGASFCIGFTFAKTAFPDSSFIVLFGVRDLRFASIPVSLRVSACAVGSCEEKSHLIKQQKIIASGGSPQWMKQFYLFL
jgi:hypothetical protein